MNVPDPSHFGTGPSGGDAAGAGSSGGTGGEDPLSRLMAGNARFVSGRPTHPRGDPERRTGLVGTQSPFAVVLGCSDSRVPPEIVFDQGLGDLFTIRVAGNTGTDPIPLGSIEYAVAVLRCPLLVVLGHSGCGAVTSALSYALGEGSVPGAIGAVLQPIVPVAHSVADARPHEQVGVAVRRHVQNQVQALNSSPAVLQPAVADGRLAVRGAVYDVPSGEVRLLGE